MIPVLKCREDKLVFGICTNMNARSQADTGIDQASYAGKIDLDYVELPVDRIMRYNENRFENFKKEVSENPLPCLVCNNFIDSSIKLAGNEYNPELFKNYITKALERIASIGAKKVVFGSAKARSIPSYLSADEGRAAIIERLKFIASTAMHHGIEVEIEHLNRMECNCINTFEESSMIARQLNRPNIKSILDTYHFEVAGEKRELIHQNREWIGHVHFAVTTGRTMPDINEVKIMEPILEIIRDSSYDGTFSYEAYFPNQEMDNPDYREVVEFIRRFISQKQ